MLNFLKIMLSNILDRISFWSLFLLIVLLPLFFIPYSQFPIETSKGLLLVIGLVISIIFWIAARLSEGKISLPKSWFLFSSLGLLLAFFLSALFSSSQGVSFFGIMMDIGTFYFMLSAVLLMFASSVILKNIKNASIVFWGLIISSAVLFIFQGAHIFWPDLLSLGVLGGKTDNVFGTWNALGLFAGFSVMMSLFVVEFFQISKTLKWFLGILIVLSLLLSATVNFSLIWILLGIFSLIIFVYKISLSFSARSLPAEGEVEETKKRHFPILSFAVVLISLLFFMSSQFIGGFLPDRLGLINLEVKPSFSATMSVTGQALWQNPVFGAGPNKFAEVWAIYKPQVINATQFWNTSFSFGSGLLPTFASTTGFVGILAWLVFLVLFIFAGIRSIFSSIKRNMNWEVVMFFVASFYLFVASFFYSAGLSIFLLAFAFAGIFIGLSFSVRSSGEMTISFLEDPRKSFFSILLLVVLMILLAAAGFKYVEKFASVSYFGKTFSSTSMVEAENSIARALVLNQNDLYLRAYTQVYLTKINSLVSKEASSLSEADKASLQTSLDQAINGAQLAINYNPNNYFNFTALGAVYNTAGLLGVKEAYDKAIEAYKSASNLNPLNPEIKLAIAQAFFSSQRIKEARDYTKEALSLKPNYLEALIVASQIEKNDGNIAMAVSYAEKALSLAPENKTLIQYVNSLKNGSSSVSPAANDTTNKIKR